MCTIVVTRFLVTPGLESWDVDVPSRARCNPSWTGYGVISHPFQVATLGRGRVLSLLRDPDSLLRST